jgi:hypothetical protein
MQPGGHLNVSTTVGSRLGGGTKLAEMLKTVQAGLADESKAEGQRWTAREVRWAINEYRDDLAEGLVRAKNRLIRTIAITGGATYLLLALALLLGAPKTAVGYVSALYLVGAVVGLFLQLRSDAKRDSAIEDYGLATVRLVHVPLLSGIAAVAGVGLTGLAATQTLAEIFDIIDVPTMLIIAATFGLTPGLLLNQLRSEADKYKEELNQTSTAKGAASVIAVDDGDTA